MTRDIERARRIFGQPAVPGPPVEWMRPGGLPADDNRPADPARAFRGMAEDETGTAPRGPFFADPNRTCSCGVTVLLGSVADTDHLGACGAPEPEPAEVWTAITADCEQCGRGVSLGATYCSQLCRRAAIRARRPR